MIYTEEKVTDIKCICAQDQEKKKVVEMFRESFLPQVFALAAHRSYRQYQPPALMAETAGEQVLTLFVFTVD